MATQISATDTRTRPAPRLGVLQVAFVALIAAAAIVGVGVWTQAGSTGGITIESPANGGGAPLHNGLAGPSRVGQSTVAPAGNYGPGAPLHGGLAGPSQVDSGT